MTRLLLAAPAAALLLTACSGSSTPSSDTAVPGLDPGSPRATQQAIASQPAGAPSAVAGAPQAAVRTPAGASSAPTAAPAAPAVPARPAGPAAQASTAPGTYTYDSSGTVTAGATQPVDDEPTLTVDRAAAGRQHSVLEGEQGRTEQDVVVRSGGTYLARLAVTNPAFSKEFAPSPPVLLVPAPAAVGRSWSWTATSTDGKTTAALDARVTRTQTLTIGGTRVPCAVVESTLRLTGDITYTGRTTTWYDPAHRLTVKDTTRGNGNVSGFAFSTDITNVLRSLRPS